MRQRDGHPGKPLHDVRILRAMAQVFKEARPRDAISLEVLLQSLGPVRQGDELKRMDIVVESATKPTLLADTTVIHPVSRLNASAKSSGAAAKIREQQKNRAYGTASRDLRMQFTPIAVEAFGRWGARAVSLLKSLAQDKASEAAAPSFAPAAADNERRPLINHRVRTNLLKRWYRALSCALQRGNAQILRHNLVTAREIAGRGPTTTPFDLNNFVALLLSLNKYTATLICFASWFYEERGLLQ